MSDTIQGTKVLVILDSLHTKEHVYNELMLYSQLVSPGGYLIVNDTSLGGLYLREGWKPRRIGPLYGVKRFLEENPQFELAHDQHAYAVSCMHSGILRRLE